MPKRTNKPGLSSTNRPPRGMRGRGRSFRGGFYYSGYRPMRRGRYYPYWHTSLFHVHRNRTRLHVTKLKTLCTPYELYLSMKTSSAFCVWSTTNASHFSYDPTTVNLVQSVLWIQIVSAESIARIRNTVIRTARTSGQ